MMAMYSLFLEYKEEASVYLCTRYIIDHLPFMDKKFQKMAENFQKKFPYPLISLQESRENVVQRLVERFPLVAHYLFYHKCFDRQFGTMKEKIGEELKVSFLMILGRDGIRNFSKF
jgi:hypothetical protein